MADPSASPADGILTAELERLHAIGQAATEGPWEVHRSASFGVRLASDESDWPLAGNFRRDADAEFAAAARTAMPRLVAAIQRLSELADEWDAESDELDNLAEKPGTDEEGRPVVQGQAIAYHDCAQELREAITQALSGNPGAQEAQRGAEDG